MRIAYMLTSLGIGGAEKQVVALAEHMATRGHCVCLIALLGREPDEWPTHLETVYLDLRKTPASLLRGIFRARCILRSFRPDLVHSHSFHANLFARLIAGLATLQVISTIHNVYEGGRLRMLAYRLTDGLAAHTTAVSQEAAHRFVRLNAVSAGKCTVIPNAIDIEEFAPDSARGLAIRTELHAGEDFIWLAVGRVVNAKGFLNLIEAFGQVWPEFPQTQLWIAGAGAPPRSSRTEYSLIAVPRGTMDRVRRLGLRRDIPALFDAADAFALSSSWEGMPLVVGEAMAMEKPIVATDVGGVRELLGDCGTLVPRRSPEQLAAAMVAMMRLPPGTRKALGDKARRRIAEEFNTTARFAQWESFYSRLHV
jgi:glycosyltransferase involved in cell wall biosynthesis